MNRTLLLTGATSFTGVWIARAFHEHGFKVFSSCSRKKSEYSGLVALRLHYLEEFSEVFFEMDIEREDFFKKISALSPSLFIFHHHYMKNFRSPHYDSHKALAVGLAPVPRLIKNLIQAQTRGVIYSGSAYEPKESGKPHSYGEIKERISEELQSQCKKNQIYFSKIVIPDPVGPLENEDRFIPTLIRCKNENKEFKLSNPDHELSHIPVNALADYYVRAAENLLEGHEEILRPQGWIISNREWLKEVCEHLFEDLPQVDSFWIHYRHYLKTGEPWMKSPKNN